MPAPASKPAPAQAATSVPTPAPTPKPTPTTTSPGLSSSLSFEQYPCQWERDLQSMAGATFEGATIRADGGVSVCQDCAQRCFAQMQRTCVGFRFEPSSDSNRGTCTYFSRIESIQISDNIESLALTTTAQFDGLSMPALLQLYSKYSN